MDHKVSKDMISSGMIPSGEKTQADLGRTQYGSAPSPSSLFDAYKSIYEHHQKDKDGNTIPHEGEELNEGKIPAGLQAYLDKKKGKKEDKKEIKEEPISLGLLAAGAGKLLAGAGAKAAAAGATKAAAAGATKAAAAGAGKAAIAKGGLTKTITRAGIKAGGKTGGRIAQSIAKDPMGALDKAADLSYKAQMVGSMLPKPVIKSRGSGGGVSGGMSQTVSAGADLFDIVKGQLLDEGLSEEEIKDIMLTLTPDEILNEISGDLLRKATVAAGDKAAKLASQKDTAGAVKKIEQQKRLSSAMKSKNLEKSRAENMRKPTQYDRPLSRPTPDPTKPYPGTPR